MKCSLLDILFLWCFFLAFRVTYYFGIDIIHICHLCTRLPPSKTSVSKWRGQFWSQQSTTVASCPEHRAWWGRSWLLFIAHKICHYFANEWLLPNNQDHIHPKHNSHLNALWKCWEWVNVKQTNSAWDEICSKCLLLLFLSVACRMFAPRWRIAYTNEFFFLLVDTIRISLAMSCEALAPFRENSLPS